ncbi:MFS transporter [Microbacterium karelineae]|uniref:MFS transporter n=1 Tax=Microbacterium karelineae TaxID=2654283 RepID=UPI001E4C6B9F|nr:MFS transporter [Microbacterium karelineae]
MTQTPPTSADRRVSLGLLFGALCLIAVNMRTPITGIGPLLEQISASTGRPLPVLSLLTSVPVISWAVVSSVAHPLTRRFGTRRVVLWALVLLVAGTIVRSLPGAAAEVELWLGTGVIGVTLALLNVLMPAVVKRSFGSRVPAVTSIYTALLAGCGAVASSLVVPVSYVVSGGEGSAGWRVALVAMIATLPIAIALWAWHMRQAGPDEREARRAPDAPPRAPRRSVWGDRTAWLVGLYMGAQSTLFYAMLTWTAPYARSLGRSELTAGNDVMILQIIGVIGSLVLPFLMRGALARWMPSIIPVVGTIGIVGLMIAPQGIVVWLMIQGLYTGSSLAISLTLMATRARDHRTASALSGMAQSVGYVISGAAPLIFGAILTATGGWEWAFGYVLVALAAQLVLGLFVGRERHVFDGPP